jgi:hypothetical protein
MIVISIFPVILLYMESGVQLISLVYVVGVISLYAYLVVA